MTTTRAIGIASLTAVSILGTLHACSSPSGVATIDTAVEAGASDARVERAPPTYDDGPYASPYEGWDLFHEYDPGCLFYVPKAREYLPPPIRWEPCRAHPLTAGKVCRSMVLDWSKSKLGEMISPGTRGMRRPDGSIALLTARYQADTTFRIIAPLDGPLFVAIRENGPTHCVLNSEVSNGDHYAFRVLDREAKGEVSEYGGGAIGGRLDELRPKALRHYHDSATRGFIAGAPGLLEVSGGAMMLHRWSDGAFVKTIWSSAQEEGGLQQSYQFYHADALFWLSSSLAIRRHKVFTETGGVQDFLSFGNDLSRGAGALGTDGADMVWIEGSGRTDPKEPFAQVLAVTAPFTTDPAKLQATRRVLRSDLTSYPFATGPFVVGCGWAARTMDVQQPDGTWINGTLVLRLSDGRSWHLPSPQSGGFGWETPLGLTCDELIIIVSESPAPGEIRRSNVARVRLDSLGPGAPP